MRYLLALLCCGSASYASGGVRWRDDRKIEPALEEAAKQGKWVALEIFATWCGPCHQMEREVYSRADVASAMDKDFVTLRFDGEQAYGEHIVEKYRVTGYPTLLVLDAEGVEIDRVMGTLAPSELLRTLADWRSGKGTLADLEAQLASRPTDLDLMWEVGRRQAMRGHVRDAERHLGALVRADAKNERGLASKGLHALGKYLYVRAVKDYRKGIATLQELRRAHPKSPEAADTVEPIARAWHRLGKPAKARALLDEYLAAAPSDSKRHNLYAWFSYKQNFDRLRGLEVAARGLSAKPDDAGLWDTMAELYFALGLRAQAVACAVQATTLDPKTDYYVQQLERFRSAPTALAIWGI